MYHKSKISKLLFDKDTDLHVNGTDLPFSNRDNCKNVGEEATTEIIKPHSNILWLQFLFVAFSACTRQTSSNPFFDTTTMIQLVPLIRLSYSPSVCAKK